MSTILIYLGIWFAVVCVIMLWVRGAYKYEERRDDDE